MKFASLVVFCGCLLLFSGCSLLGRDGFEEPEVHIQNIRLEEASLFQTGFVFSLRIDNGSSTPLSFEGGAHKIYLNDVYVGKGLSSERIRVPKFGSTETDVTVFVNNLAVIGKIVPILESQSLSYRIDSSLERSSGFLSRRVHLSQSDTLVLERQFDTSKLRSLTGNTF